MGRSPRRDLPAGLTVAIVALPLAPGFWVSSGLVLVLTAVATVALDLVYAVIIGLLVAGALALRAVAEQAHQGQVSLKADLSGDHRAGEHALLDEHIVAYGIDGPLFFAVAHRFLPELSEVADGRVVILRMSRVTTVDVTGALVLKGAVTKLNRRGITVLASGIRPGRRRVLDSVGALGLLRAATGDDYADTSEAVAAARSHLRSAGTLPTAPAVPAQARSHAPAAVITEESSR